MLSLWDPFVDFDRMRRELDTNGVQGRRFVPAVDIEEKENAFVLHAELPGVKREDLHIEVHDDVLTLKGERKVETQESEGKFQRVERRYGSFERRFSLPQHIDSNGIEAKLTDGVLELTLPKRPEVTPRRIEVNAA